VSRRRAVVDEWSCMTYAERVRWCEAKLSRLAELEQQAAQYRGSPQYWYDENMRTFAKARYDITNVLNGLHGAPMPAEYLTTWGRLNRWVTRWAEADRRRTDARRANAFCWTCLGRGVTIAGSLRLRIVRCQACGGTGRKDVRMPGY